MVSELIEKCRIILSSEIPEKDAVDQVCQLIILKEPWRKKQTYPFTMSDLLSLHDTYRKFHSLIGKTYFLEKEKAKTTQKEGEIIRL